MAMISYRPTPDAFSDRGERHLYPLPLASVQRIRVPESNFRDGGAKRATPGEHLVTAA